MLINWTSHLTDPEEKVRFQNQVLSARPVLERLHQLLTEDEKRIDFIDTSVKQFDNPNWAYRQAFNNGGRATYNFIKKLINLDQQKDIITNERNVTDQRRDHSTGI